MLAKHVSHGVCLRVDSSETYLSLEAADTYEEKEHAQAEARSGGMHRDAVYAFSESRAFTPIYN